jgi:hypothetical protein
MIFPFEHIVVDPAPGECVRALRWQIMSNSTRSGTGQRLVQTSNVFGIDP